MLLEIGAAWGFKKHIAPVAYNVAVDQVPDIVRTRKIVDLVDFDAYVEQLVRRATNARSR